MLQPINDTNLEDEVWLDHNPLDGSQIGGAMPTEYELITDIPGQPHAIMLATKGPAWSTMEAYCVRPNFIAAGCPYQRETFTLNVGTKSKPHIFEFDLIAIFEWGGVLWKADGSVQINPDAGWILMVDPAAPPPPAVPAWVSTKVMVSPLAFGVPHVVVVDHFTDVSTNPPTHSVLAVSVDGTPYQVPDAFQRIPCTVSTWTGAKNKSLIQMQTTAGPLGGMVDETFTAIAVQHRIAA